MSMKQLANPVKVVEVEGKGLLGYLGKNITLYCAGFIYSGTLTGVNETCLELDPAYIVYDTGSFSSKSWQTVEKFPHAWNVQLSSIESFGELKGS